MLVGKVDSAGIDTLGDFLADLVWIPAGDHVKTGPSVLDFWADGGANEEVELFLGGRVCLEVVVFDMVRDGLAMTSWRRGEESQRATYSRDSLGIADSGEA